MVNSTGIHTAEMSGGPSVLLRFPPPPGGAGAARRRADLRTVYPPYLPHCYAPITVLPCTARRYDRTQQPPRRKLDHARQRSPILDPIEQGGPRGAHPTCGTQRANGNRRNPPRGTRPNPCGREAGQERPLTGERVRVREAVMEWDDGTGGTEHVRLIACGTDADEGGGA